MFTQGASLSFLDCEFTRNCVADPGLAQCSGVYSSASSIILIDCNFNDNELDSAIQNADNTSALIVGSSFANHVFSSGGPSSIRNINSSATIINCDFRDNDDEVSGAIWNSSSELKLFDCGFYNNNGDFAGAIWNDASTVKIASCIFVGNSGGDYAGGCVTNDISNVIIVNCAFIGNDAEVQAGGAINNEETDAIIVNCAFSGNQGTRGGAIANFASEPSVINCSFSRTLPTHSF